MLRSYPTLHTLICCWLLLSGAAAADSPTPPSIAAVAIDTELTPDGVLDEAAWQRAPASSGFVQRRPAEGAVATEDTEFRVLFSSTTLYVGIRAFDRQPEALIARELRRDGALFRDDGLVVLLDTFHDQRNSFFFETNPLGARTDSLITDEGNDVNFEWDGVWQVGTQVDSQGWTAEYAIPFSTLRYNPGDTTWGLQIRRYIRHKNEITFWAPLLLDANIFRVSLFGDLTDLRPPKRGLGLGIEPFVTANISEFEGAPRDEESDVGLDIKWGLTRNLTLDLTYNTDFAEVEADALQVNLTRFPLFFPEKRDFFLENAGVFKFGPGAPQLGLFFSRRIGIDGGRQVPLDLGARLTGRVGPWTLGLLEVLTEDLAAEDGAEAVPKTSWSVARIKRDLGQRSNVGAMLTQRDPSGGDSDRSWGIDLNLNPTKRLKLTAFAAGTEGNETQDTAAGASARWQSSVWEVSAAAKEIGDDFAPAMGFVSRRGVRRYDTYVKWAPRTAGKGAIESFFFDLRTNMFTDLEGRIESRTIDYNPFGIRWKQGHFFTFFGNLRRERLTEPFEISDGVLIAPGDYHFEDFGAFFSSDGSRPLSIETSAFGGSFYDGDRLSGQFTLLFRPSKHLFSETSWSYNDIDLPAGEFSTELIRQRISVPINPDLQINAFVQYSDAQDLTALNLRLRWIYRPGSDLFVVYNQTWDAPGLSQLSPRDRQLSVKWTYLLQR